MRTYQVNDFDYELPSHLIAQHPCTDRSASRLLCINRAQGGFDHRIFRDIVSLISPKDLVVFNNTKVIAARLLGYKATGGKIECLIERVIDDRHALAMIRASRSPAPSTVLSFADGQLEFRVVGRHGELFELELLSKMPLQESLEHFGQLPLPPYIDRKPSTKDQTRYQTVFAKKPGAVAAPTAGLHFTEQLLAQLAAKGVSMQQITLHVGSGTFQPIRSATLANHEMHKESMVLSPTVCEAVAACRQRGGRVIAVGTTVVRCLETAAAQSELKPYQGETQLFITPGFEFKVIDGLITNFHLPKSTLLMLVSAFTGYDLMHRAYQEAIAKEYRFYSYGDAMFIA